MSKKIILVLLALLIFMFNASVINASDSSDSYNENELSEIKNYENTDIALKINNQIKDSNGRLDDIVEGIKKINNIKREAPSIAQLTWESYKFKFPSF